MNLADKTVLNVLAKSSEALLLMISSVVMVRCLPKDEYGTFLQIMLIASTAIMFTALGLPQSIFYFFQRTGNRRNFVIRNVLLSLVIGIMTSLLVYGLKNELAHWLNNPLLMQYARVAPLLILFRAPSFFREPILISHGSLILNSISTLLWNLIFFGPVTIAALFSVSLAQLLIVMITSAGAQLCLYLGVVWWVIYHIHDNTNAESDHNVSLKKVSFKEQLKYALPIGASSYMDIIGRQIDQYIVSAFFTPKDFAVYSRGAMRIPFLSTLQFTINRIVMPKYIIAYQTNDIKSFLATFHICIEKVAKINFLAFSFFFAAAPSLITFLYTKNYVEASSIFRVYLFFLLIRITEYGMIPRASGKTSCIMYAMAIYLGSNITLSLLLVSKFGPIGPAIATIIAEIIRAVYYLFQACKILKVSFDKIFPWKYLFQLFFISLTASIPVYCINYISHFKSGPLFFVLLVDILIYCYCWIILMMRKGLIYQDDLELLKRWLHFDVERVLRRIALLP